MIDFNFEKEDFYIIYQDNNGEIYLETGKTFISGKGEVLDVLEHADGKRLVTRGELIRNYMMVGSF